MIGNYCIYDWDGMGWLKSETPEKRQLSQDEKERWQKVPELE
jgi:hypothetical protein